MLDQEVRRWSATDAAELYDVARWGKGYFSVGDERARAGPSRQGPRAVDRPEGAGRPAAAARHRPADPDPLRRHPQASAGARSTRRLPSAIAEHDYQGSYCCVYPIKVNQQRQVVEEVLRFGKPYQLRPGGGQQAGTAGRGGHDRQRHADHLQRLQGRRVHRDGDAGPEDRPQDHSGRREVHRAGADPASTPRSSACGRRSACASSWRPAARDAGSRRAAIARSSG